MVINFDDPSLIKAKVGDVIVFNGDQFVLQDALGVGYCLTSLDSKIEEYIQKIPDDFSDSGFLVEAEEPSYEAFIRHVRIGNKAVFTIDELAQSIRDDTFTIDHF